MRKICQRLQENVNNGEVKELEGEEHGFRKASFRNRAVEEEEVSHRRCILVE